MPLTSKDRQNFNAVLFPVPDNTWTRWLFGLEIICFPKMCLNLGKLATWAWKTGTESLTNDHPGVS